MAEAYLDNSATTRVCGQAAEAALHAMTACYGNPSSLHTKGIEAERLVTSARRSVARLLGADEGELVFTSGGTEANNLAVLGGARALRRRGNHVVITAMEHPSVAKAAAQLAAEGFEVTAVAPDINGDISAQALIDACRADTVLVSAMLVNNEVGSRVPLPQAVADIRRRSPLALIHADAVQAAGKLPLTAHRWGIDLMSMSGHKLHAPKGVGALYIRKGVRVLPTVYGGGQERGLRSGTEAVPAIAALGAAADALLPYDRQQEHYEALRSLLWEQLADLPDIRRHTPQNGVPYVINFSLMGRRSETLVHFLAEREVYVSSGSACAGGKGSPTLAAMGLPKAEIDAALRVSLCMDNTNEDILRLSEALHEAAHTVAVVR